MKPLRSYNAGPGPATLRVGLIAPCAVTVPPTTYGGTESVVDLLARGLAMLGHDVVLYTVGTSTCPVDRRWSIPEAVGTGAPAVAETKHAFRAYQSLNDVDIIHDHTQIGPLLTSAHSSDIPIVATVHGNCSAAPVSALIDRDPRVDLVAISHDQCASAPQLGFATVIHHGVEIDRYPLGRGDGDYVLFLGRMEPDKGVHRAITIARRAGRRILIAAKMWEASEHAYFHERVEPLLGADAVFIGEVDLDRKIDLIGGAEALINPIRWREPFGLVMIESLACGTPVLTFPEGAAPEIVDDGVTGFLCEGEADMVDALERVPALSREACRDECSERFSMEHMVNKHLQFYAKMLSGPAVTDQIAQAK